MRVQVVWTFVEFSVVTRLSHLISKPWVFFKENSRLKFKKSIKCAAFYHFNHLSLFFMGTFCHLNAFDLITTMNKYLFFDLSRALFFYDVPNKRDRDIEIMRRFKSHNSNACGTFHVRSRSIFCPFFHNGSHEIRSC